MKSKWLLYPTVALLLILTIALGVIAVFRSGFPKTHEQSELEFSRYSAVENIFIFLFWEHTGTSWA